MAHIIEKDTKQLDALAATSEAIKLLKRIDACVTSEGMGEIAFIIKDQAGKNRRISMEYSPANAEALFSEKITGLVSEISECLEKYNLGLEEDEQSVFERYCEKYPVRKKGK